MTLAGRLWERGNGIKKAGRQKTSGHSLRHRTLLSIYPRLIFCQPPKSFDASATVCSSGAANSQSPPIHADTAPDDNFRSVTIRYGEIDDTIRMETRETSLSFRVMCSD